MHRYLKLHNLPCISYMLRKTWSFILLNLILNIGQALMRNKIEFMSLLLNSLFKLNPGENQYSCIVEKVT